MLRSERASASESAGANCYVFLKEVFNMGILHEDVRMGEETANDAAYAMRELYVTEKTLWDCVYKATEKMDLGISKQEAELMWRAIDAFADLAA